jgi:hypothetical protein
VFSSFGSVFVFRRPGIRHCRPLVADSSTSSVEMVEQSASTQWSTPRIPDCSHMSSGVVLVTGPERIMRDGDLRSGQNCYLV